MPRAHPARSKPVRQPAQDFAICPHCGRTFVVIPGGACPHCSYPFIDILDRASMMKPRDRAKARLGRTPKGTIPPERLLP